MWEIGGCRAVRDGDWKLVTQGPEREQATMLIPPGHEDGELYDMAADRCELRNLASRHPTRARDMAAMWESWRARCDAACGREASR